MPLTTRKPPPRSLPDPPRTLGEHLLVQRTLRGVRQVDVAREIGVTVWNLINWEKGRTRPAVRFVPRIHLWLGYCPVEPGPQTLGRRLLCWRTGRGLSQVEVARRLGIDPGTVRRVETGNTMSPQIRRLLESAIPNVSPHAAPLP